MVVSILKPEEALIRGNRTCWLPLIAGLAGVGGCGPVETPNAASQPLQANPDQHDSLATALRRHIGVLASDSFLGRYPVGPGGERTVQYLVDAFEALGLDPGHPNEAYLQSVPLIEYAASTILEHSRGSDQIELLSPHELFAWSVDLKRLPPEPLALDGLQLVFAGYGISAPDAGWDDFGDVDLAGKVVMVLPGDPPVEHVNLFQQNAPSEHAGALAKAAAAAERGAEAIIVVVDPGMNGSPYEVFSQSLARERLVIEDPEPEPEPDPNGEASATSPGRGILMSPTAAVTLVANAGGDYEALRTAAASKAFAARELEGEVSMEVRATAHAARSHNVVGVIPGRDPVLKHQFVVYVAHWDHLGHDPEVSGDQIFNGAMDNAAGTAQLIEIARTLASQSTRPLRSVLFLATTGEDAGLLGSRYYVENPLYPLECTAAVLNLDGGFPYGRTRDVVAIGAGNTTLDEILIEALESQGRVLSSDPREIAFFTRSDHYPFARAGVPALFVLPGHTVVDKPEGWGEERLQYYMENHYHQPSDSLRHDHDLRGLAEDARLMFDIGLRIASDPDMPRWKSDAPFSELAAVRDSVMGNFDPQDCVAGSVN